MLLPLGMDGKVLANGNLRKKPDFFGNCGNVAKATIIARVSGTRVPAVPPLEGTARP
jgi:hypothetical protein